MAEDILVGLIELPPGQGSGLSGWTCAARLHVLPHNKHTRHVLWRDTMPYLQEEAKGSLSGMLSLFKLWAHFQICTHVCLDGVKCKCFVYGLTDKTFCASVVLMVQLCSFIMSLPHSLSTSPPFPICPRVWPSPTQMIYDTDFKIDPENHGKVSQWDWPNENCDAVPASLITDSHRVCKGTIF